MVKLLKRFLPDKFYLPFVLILLLDYRELLEETIQLAGTVATLEL